MCCLIQTAESERWRKRRRGKASKRTIFPPLFSNKRTKPYYEHRLSDDPLWVGVSVLLNLRVYFVIRLTNFLKALLNSDY